MRVRLDYLVASALQQGSAVPAFTCYDFTTALAVVAAAEEAGRGTILLVPPSTAATANGLRLIAALRGLAESAAVPVVCGGRRRPRGHRDRSGTRLPGR